MKAPLRSWIPLALYLVAMIVAGALVGTYLAGCGSTQTPPSAGGDAQTSRATLGEGFDSLQYGLELFVQNCSQCHGRYGEGDGQLARVLFPKPRNFSMGQFRLTSTSKGLPTEEDLMRTIRNGMLPSLMPPWSGLSEDQLRALAKAVAFLAVHRHAAHQIDENPQRSPQEALARAHAILDPGPPVVLPVRIGAPEADRGREVFLANCAVCHDADGRAQKRLDLVDTLDQPIRPRDLTAGPYKGGFTPEAIATRVLRGIPGTPMPSFTGAISGDDLWHLVAYVQSLKTSDYKPAETCPAEH